MAADYKIDKSRRLVLSTASGVFTAEDIRGHMDRLTADSDFDPDFYQLADFTAVTAMKVSPDDIRMFAERTVFSPRSRRAFVVKDDAQFGLARMFEIHRDLKDESGIRVFRSIQDGLEWIETGASAS
jgi:hypothetical protein